MRLLKWFFSVRQRHRGGIRRYEKGGAGVRIFTLILLFVFAGGTLALEWWGFSLAEKSFLVSLLVIILLSIPFLWATVEFGGVYAVTAMRMFVWGVADRAARRAEQRDVQYVQYEGQIYPVQGAQPPAGQAPKTHRALDMVVFLLCLAVAVGILIAYIVVAVGSIA